MSFHIDTLPCIPEEPTVVQVITARGVPRHLAESSIAITDKRHPRYAELTRDWPCSNPRGLGRWFEERAAQGQIRVLVENRACASIDKVPPYRWKTPLQRAIQILKRHRDVMYKDDPDVAPISMIITVLAARAYRGEVNLDDALAGIIDRMGSYVGDARPRIPNPVNPAEDFSDKWGADSRLEENFWLWLEAVRADATGLQHLLATERLPTVVRKAFAVDLTEEELRGLRESTLTSPRVPATVKAAPAVRIESPPKPWRIDG